MAGFWIDAERRPGGATVLTVRGEIEWANSRLFKAGIDQAFAGSPVSLELDLTRVAFMNSEALSMLIAAHRRASDAGVCMTVRAGAFVAWLLQRTGTADALGVTPPEPAESAPR